MTAVRGVDLSGTLEDAGGIGGLLRTRLHETIGTSDYYPTYDANGNVSEYVDSSGTVVAHYEYAPFGGVTAATGTMPDSFAFRFSTKYLDSETALWYYGYRYYDAANGRWLSRDPLGEAGGLNLRGFVTNSPLVFRDPLGLLGWRDWGAVVWEGMKGFVGLSDIELPDSARVVPPPPGSLPNMGVPDTAAQKAGAFLTEGADLLVRNAEMRLDARTFWGAAGLWATRMLVCPGHKAGDLLQFGKATGEAIYLSQGDFLDRGAMAGPDMVRFGEMLRLNAAALQAAANAGHDHAGDADEKGVHSAEGGEGEGRGGGEPEVDGASAKPDSPGAMQKDVERGRAPREVEGVHRGHVKGQEPHVHYKDGTSSTSSGKTHDKHRGTPDPNKKTAEWLKKHNWVAPNGDR